MDTLLVEYEKARAQLITWFGELLSFEIFHIILFLI
jgi:hypothetical protein